MFIQSPGCGWYSLASGVLLLSLAVSRNQVEGLGLVLQHGVGVAAEDDDDIKVLETLVSLLVGDLGADDDARVAQNFGLGTGNGDFEGLGFYMGTRKSANSCVTKLTG